MVVSAGDVIYTNMPTQGPDAPIPNVQYFWEAFPSGSGSTDRTTYLFTYIDADPSRHALQTYESWPCKAASYGLCQLASAS